MFSFNLEVGDVWPFLQIKDNEKIVWKVFLDFDVLLIWNLNWKICIIEYWALNEMFSLLYFCKDRDKIFVIKVVIMFNQCLRVNNLVYNLFFNFLENRKEKLNFKGFLFFFIKIISNLKNFFLQIRVLTPKIPLLCSKRKFSLWIMYSQ